VEQTGDPDIDERQTATLHALRVKGLAQPEDVERISGVDGAAAVLAELVDADLATSTGGWFSATAAGLERDRELLRERVGANAPALAEIYDERFLPVNVRFKALATAWQEQGEQFELIEQAAEIHDEVDAFLEAAAAYAAHLARYRERLGELMDEFLSGHPAVLTAATGPSYHNAWFELHEDLIATLGRDREKEAA
jgi:hypothetical protein